MAKEAVISVASSSFPLFDSKICARQKRKKKKEKEARNWYLVADVRLRDPPTEIVLLFSGDASESIAIPSNDFCDPFSFLIGTKNKKKPNFLSSGFKQVEPSQLDTACDPNNNNHRAAAETPNKIDGAWTADTQKAVQPWLAQSFRTRKNLQRIG